MRGRVAASMQKTYDDCYLMCSTAIYFESLSNEAEALRSWKEALNQIYYFNAYKLPANYRPSTETEKALQDSLRNLELQCKERVDLLEALRRSRQTSEEQKGAGDVASREEVSLSRGKTPTSGPDVERGGWLGEGTIPPVDYPDLSRPPSLPVRPLISRPLVSRNPSSQSVARAQSPSQPPRPSNQQSLSSSSLGPQQIPTRNTPSPERKVGMLRTLRPGSKEMRRPTSRPTGPGHRPPAAAKAATQAWDSLFGANAGPMYKGSNGSSLSVLQTPRDSIERPASTRAGTGERNTLFVTALHAPAESMNHSKSTPNLPTTHRDGSDGVDSDPPMDGEDQDFLERSVSAGYLPDGPGGITDARRDSEVFCGRAAEPKAVLFESRHARVPDTETPSSKPYRTSRLAARSDEMPPPILSIESSPFPIRRKAPPRGPKPTLPREQSDSAGIGNRSGREKPETGPAPNLAKVTIDHSRDAPVEEETLNKLSHTLAEQSIRDDEREEIEDPWHARVKAVMKKLPKGVDEMAARQIFNEIVIHGDEVHWNDVAGLDIAKTALKETVVYPFLRPDLFMGLREPARGMLLFGPPGTGKTMLARAVATESKSTFFAISASSLTSKYLGESEKLVRALFALAKTLAPSIIFVDEIDSLLSARSGSGEHEATRRIKTEFLIQWSDLAKAAAGREQSDKDKEKGDASRVLVLAATNLPWAIDEAARRRFVRRQYIPLPEPHVRRVQLQTLLGHQKHNLTVAQLDSLIALTEGFSGSDITALAKDAAMGPLRSLGERLLSMTMDEIRPIQFSDFEASLRTIRPSVSKQGLKQYEDWAKEFGERGG